MKTYRTTTSDEDVFHVFDAENDEQAKNIGDLHCDDDRVDLWNLEELDEDYSVIRTVF